MAQDYLQVNFRIPTELKEQIEEAAKENNRSITSELVSRLERTFQEDELTQIKQSHPEINALEIMKKAEFFLVEAMAMRSQVEKELDKIKKITQDLNK